MTAETSSDKGAENQTSEENPFADFQSEEYARGERVEEPAAPKPPKPVDASDDVSETPDDDDETAEDDAEDDSDAGKSKPKQTAQERINELTRKYRDEERQREALEARIREMETVRREPDSQEEEDPSSEDGETKEDTPPDPESFEYGELDPRYIRALASYEAKQQFASLVAEQKKEQQEAAVLRAQQEAQQKFESKIEEGSKKYDDFYEKVMVGAEKGEWPLSADLGNLLVESEVGADIAYHLASNPDEAAKVYRQSPVEQARYFGRMEAKFSAAQDAALSEDAEKPAPPKTPKAPAPVTPARGSDGKFQPSASSDDFAAFEQSVMTQEK